MTEGQAVDASSGDEAKQFSSAPYSAYTGFKNLLGKFATEGEGLPGRFDSTYFGNASGSLVAQTRGTLRYFGLMDEDKHPTERLKSLVAADERERQQQLRQMFQEAYPDALALSANATAGQLAEVFRARGLSGATVQKAVNFFLGMAEDVGVEVSPHFKKGRASTTNGGSRRRRTSKAAEPAAAATASAPAAPVADTSPTALRAKYVNLLMKKVEQAEDDLPSELLDRIERALELESQRASVRTTEEAQQDLP